MKRNIRKTLNFFAFNILFFAIYLNFIQKDKSFEPTLVQTAPVVTTSAPEMGAATQSIEKKAEVTAKTNIN